MQAAADTDTDVPPNHPPIELPAEIVAFLDELAKAADAAPDDVEAWRKLARARYRAGMLNPEHYASAEQAVGHLLELAPQDAEALRLKANIAYDTRRFADAEKAFRRYLEIDAHDPGVRTDLASAVLFQGRAEEARKMYESVIESHPDFVQAHVNLGITLHGEGKSEEALASLRRARELAVDPQQRERVEMILAAAEGRAPSDAVDGAAAAGGPLAASPGGQHAGQDTPGMPPGAGAQAAPRATARAAPATNAKTGFQKGVDALFTNHPIVAPKIASIDWTAENTAAVHLVAFPMDKMPPVMRNKFKSTMNEKIAKLAAEHAIASPRIELVDDGSGSVMDSLDAKELVGAFDPQE
jgi:Flp pilus assembly protein TadD